MEYLLTGVEQSNNIRSYAFAEVDRNVGRTSLTVAVDISLLRKYAIPLQELPLLCRHFLEKQREAGSNQNLIFGEAEMVQYANRRDDALRVLEARKAQRKRHFGSPEHE